MTSGNLIKRIADSIKKINLKTVLYCAPVLFALCTNQLLAKPYTKNINKEKSKTLDGQCYNGYRNIVQVYDQTNPTDTLTDTIGVNHAVDYAWSVYTTDFDTGTVVNIDFVDSTGTIRVRTKQELHFPDPFGDLAPVTFFPLPGQERTHCVYGNIFNYISPDSSDTVEPYGSSVTAHVPGKDSCSLDVFITANLDDYHGDIWNGISGIQLYDTVVVKLRKQQGSVIYGKDTSFILDTLWQPPLYRIDATNIDLQLEPTDTLGIKEKDLERKVNDIKIYPNPAHNKVYFESFPAGTKTEIYDIAGRLIKNLAKGKKWNFTDEKGKKVPAGVYFVRFQAGNKIANKKLILLK